MHCAEICSPIGVGFSLAAMWFCNLIVILCPITDFLSFFTFSIISLFGIVFTKVAFRSTKYAYNYQTKEKTLLTPKEKRILYSEVL